MSQPVTLLERFADSLPGAAAGVTLRGKSILVDGLPAADVPQAAAGWMRHHAPPVWPNTPHGEPRQTLLYGIVKDAGSYEGPGGRPLDGTLIEALEQELPGDTNEQRQALAAAMIGKFWTKASGRGRGARQDRRYLLPLHASLPLGFRQEKARGGKTAFAYKMFRGSVLPFLLSDAAGEVDQALLESFLAVFGKDTDLTRLDKEVLRIAGQLAPDTSGPDVQTLVSSAEPILRELQRNGGAFCQPSLAQFREDLAQVLKLDLPRRDLINQLTLLLALHLTVRLYRASLVLSRQLDRCVAPALAVAEAGLDPSPCAGGCCGDASGCDLAGQMKFRAGTGSYRPVKLTDSCVRSYRALTSGFLLPLPVTVSAANFVIDTANRILAADGRNEIRSMDLSALQNSMTADSGLRTKIDGVARLLAVCRRFQLRSSTVADFETLTQRHLPGVYELRLALLEGRRTTMRHEGRDVVHQLAKDVRSGRVMASNGPAVTFFELDEDMLYLLVRLICHNRLQPFSQFVIGLRRYGFAPQDGAEEQLLQEALERLGMLQRYSDASESAYVHHTEADIDEEITP